MGEAPGMSSERQRWPAAPGEGRAPQGAAQQPGGISPIKAFAGLVALLIAAGTLLLLTKPESTSQFATHSTAKGDNFALTSAEARQTFLRLRKRYIQAIRIRDESYLSQVLTSFSPNRRLATREIRQLLADGVIDRSRVQIIDVEILSHDVNEIRVRERLLLHPCFETERGTDVSQTHQLVEQINVWSMRKQSGAWKLHLGELQEDRSLNRRSSCG